MIEFKIPVVVEFQFIYENNNNNNNNNIVSQYISDFESICGNECKINAQINHIEEYNGVLFGQMLGMDTTTSGLDTYYFRS